MLRLNRSHDYDLREKKKKKGSYTEVIRKQPVCLTAPPEARDIQQ